jgi:flagellar biosynthesis chaperone FliJ
MSDGDKRVFQQLIDDLNSNIAKNRSNIQLLAKEMQKTAENMLETEQRCAEISNQAELNKTMTDKSMVELEA